MKYMLVLYYAAGITTGQTATSIGPYDDYSSCKIVEEMVIKDRWEAKCYPIGKVEKE